MSALNEGKAQNIALHEDMLSEMISLRERMRILEDRISNMEEYMRCFTTLLQLPGDGKSGKIICMRCLDGKIKKAI